VRLTGFAAIEFAEKQNLRLNKHPTRLEGPVSGLSVAEAEAIADDDESVIYLDVPDEVYNNAPPTLFEPDR